MPRQLEDVLDYLLPRAASAGAVAARPPRAAALPILTLPVPPDDVLCAAIAYNLAVSLARTGLQVSVVLPEDPSLCELWPDSEPQPLGLALVSTRSADLAELGRAALDVAVGRLADARDGGIVLVCVPPALLFRADRAARALLRWCLLFSLPDRDSLRASYAVAKRALALEAGIRVGLTLHGVRSLQQAERAFERIARVAARQLGTRLVSYGLLVDDLQVYRSIAARRPVALAQPQSPATRALAEVAELIRSEVQERGGA